MPLADRGETTAAITSAAEAQRAWAEWNPQRRARVLPRFLQLAEQGKDTLARLLSAEHGKPVADAHGDLQRGLDVVEFAAGTPHLLKGEFSDNAGTGIDWDRDRHFPVDVLRKAAGLGLGGVHVREQHGGYLSIHNMVAWMIDHYDDASQRERRLPRLCAMDDLASYCLTESGAGAAPGYVVMARTGEPGPRGISAFLVDKDDPGISFGPNERRMGWYAQPTRQVVLDGVRIPADRLLGRAGEGFRIAMNGLNGGRLGIAACSLVGARSALDRSLAHLADGEAFGARLLDAQALRFRLAGMATELTAARALDARDPQAPYLCAMAKRFATDTGYSVADRALQLHGGYGYHDEYGIEKIVRDLRVHQILEGTNEIMRVIVARGLTEALG